MNSQKKLTRGLSEISPLFRKKAAGITSVATAPAPSAPFDPSQTHSRPSARAQFLSVFSCDDLSDSFLLSSYLAAKMGEKEESCLLLSVEEQGQQKLREQRKIRGPVKQVALDWEELTPIWKNPSELTADTGTAFDPMVFIDFNILRVPAPQRVVSLLDHCILLVQPRLESLMECYRMVKMSLRFNPQLQFFMIYDGAQTDERGTEIFQKLSDMITRHLGVEFGWLGCSEKMSGEQGNANPLALEPLFLNANTGQGISVEKKGLGRLTGENLLGNFARRNPVNDHDQACHSGALGRKTSDVGTGGESACRQARFRMTPISGAESSFFKQGKLTKEELSDLIDLSLHLKS